MVRGTWATDWVEWHREYDAPDSRRSRRLAVVQRYARDALDAIDGPLRIVSICAGEGRDLLPVLAEHARGRAARALLAELDPHIAATAAATATDLGLLGVTVACADAALTDTYAEAVPVDIVLACGVFGNITEGDITRTIAALPSLCAPNAIVIWTRATRSEGDAIAVVRRAFADAGFDEVALHAAPDETFRVGMHRLGVPPAPYRPGERMFRFVRKRRPVAWRLRRSFLSRLR